VCSEKNSISTNQTSKTKKKSGGTGRKEKKKEKEEHFQKYFNWNQKKAGKATLVGNSKVLLSLFSFSV